jgi:hypothetical protein
MVHAINAPQNGANTFQAYKDKAKAVSENSTSPKDGFPAGGLRKLTVQVAPVAGQFTFVPSNITELPRTVVEFAFNPKNHSVVQSSFADPCHPLAAGGFSSGFIPTMAKAPLSGATFDIVVNDTKPIWLYCAQTTGGHCQAGMVASINAPTTGDKTLAAFIELAKKADTSTIPPNAPIGGLVTINGTVINDFGGASFKGNTSDIDNGVISVVPPPGSAIPPSMSGDAGGAPPSQYGWAPSISDDLTNALQLLQWIDNLFLDILVNGHNKLTTGAWSNQYPKSITDSIGSMTAQAMVHRNTATDCLKHYNKDLIQPCKYNYPSNTVDDFISTSLTVLHLEIGILLTIMASFAGSDSWMIAPLASTMGSKSRMAGLINMMQNHLAASAVREVALPLDLVYSYATSHYIVAGSCPDKLAETTVYPMLTVSDKVTTGQAPKQRLTSMTVKWDGGDSNGDLWMAFLGPWGSIEYSQVSKGASGTGTVNVPASLYGWVWGTLTNKRDVAAKDLGKSTVAGPEMIWVTSP